MKYLFTATLLLFVTLVATLTITLTATADEAKLFYINAEGVKARATPEENGRILGLLDLNDTVSTTSSNDHPLVNFVQVQIVQTKNPILRSEKYFVAREFLSEQMVDYKIFMGKYFIILNIASETLRLYERKCPEKYCTNTMLMETEVVVGEDRNHESSARGKGRSLLGSYRITGWTKYYEDGESHYPSWYNETYPSIPKASVHDPLAWLDKKYMPVDSYGNTKGVMRGAFGWYTAFLGPNHFGQWLHGTIGWGEDKDFYIKSVKKLFPNIFFDPRSSGCTRNNNEAIAYLRYMVGVGTPVIKIYAEESLFDPTLRDYPIENKKWDYVLTKQKTKNSDRESVIKDLGLTSEAIDAYWAIIHSGDVVTLDPANPLNQILEAGTYDIDNHPDAIKFTPGERMSRLQRKLGRNGNVYGLRSGDMQGMYFVDIGMLYNYEHPKKVLEVGGFPDEVSPPWMTL
jgi:hypothetical protein